MWLRVGALVGAVVLATTMAACSNLQVAPGGYSLKAKFPQAIGVYKGSPVRILGVGAGTVTSVEPQGHGVLIGMRIDKSIKLPSDVQASIIPVSVIGEMYIDLSPAYSGGPVYDHNRVLTRTHSPVSLDELLRSTGKLAGAMKPSTVRRVLNSLSRLLNGRGQQINDLIRKGSGVVQLLAAKSDDIGSIIDSSDQLVSALQSQGANIQSLVINYQRLSKVFADNSGAIVSTITNFNQLSAQLIDLFQRHAGPLKFDVGQITHVGRTLDRNLDTLRSTFASTNALFTHILDAYDPSLKSLRINQSAQSSEPFIRGSYFLRDRIAGMCRRLHIAACSDPASPLMANAPNLFIKILDLLPNGGSTPTAAPAAPSASAPSARAPSAAQAAPSTPSTAIDSATGQMLAQLLGRLDAKQVAALRASLDPALALALAALTPDQMQRLAHVSGEKLAALRNVPDDEVAAALQKLIDAVTPAELLQPLLPPPGRPGSSLLPSVLNGLGAGS